MTRIAHSHLNNVNHSQDYYSCTGEEMTRTAIIMKRMRRRRELIVFVVAKADYEAEMTMAQLLV